MSVEFWALCGGHCSLYCVNKRTDSDKCNQRTRVNSFFLMQPNAFDKMKMCATNTTLLQGKESASGHNVIETQDILFPSYFTNDETHQGNSVEKDRT